MRMTKPVLTILVAVLLLPGVCQGRARDEPDADAVRRFVDSHCADCHDNSSQEAGLSLEDLNASDVGQSTDAWEMVLRRLERREMPPLDMPRPKNDDYETVISQLEARLDHAAAENPDPGRTDTFRRLTRTEYGNAIRDLLALEIDVTTLLPVDESSHGFDNVTVGNLSPTLLNRYVSAAQKISRLAVGGPMRSPGGHVIRLRPDLTQEEHVEGLPIGTRGGVLIHDTFPRDGVYEIQVRLMRDRNEHVEGLKGEHELEVMLDRGRVKLFALRPPKSNSEHATVDAHLSVRVPVAAGPHAVGVTFVKQTSALLESKRQPYDAHFNFYRHPRLSPAIYEVSITGPHESDGPGDTPSRKHIFGITPASAGDADDEEQRARKVLSRLLRRAYRRPVTANDLQQPLQFYQSARAGGDFEDGIQAALSAILVNPNFLFRVERDPPAVPPGTAYTISEFELASRLSFFLWSSLPDDQLLDLAERGELSRPDMLEAQVRRMLRDERSRSLVTNFASQWLYLRNLKSLTPDLRTFPDFDDNLRQAFRQETELFIESILREDRSVLDLIDADYTFLNGRLAKHYDIPYVYGSRFRRVPVEKGEKRGGLLRQGSILMATSYATRTSPVIRGKWILENLLGSPPPPPPDNVPSLENNTVAADLPVRQRLAAHRANAACASCHNLIDPLGLALENFDAVGRWRDVEAGMPVDASGGLPDGTLCDGIGGLEQGLLARPEIFVGTLVEKLLTYALGRGMEPGDAPAVRQILRHAEEDEYLLSALIVGIAHSKTFQMRKTP
jgi:Protein of unknown function (DUF1592)/Protein of unknown function (DUF1588)/Protein of unknown function (DUF1595)/Protein of unknown function (DUF1587)/Protein of unknown function (DUF1585)/Planctomycete cytochrome C